MGTLRTLLAITVVLSHTYGHIFLGGRLAVQMFYIISGFLISYILVEANSYENKKKFYFNRFLRLFPAYYFVSIITLLFFIYLYLIGKDTFFSSFYNIDIYGKIYFVITNFLILGQDIAFFTGVKNGIFQPMINYSDSEIIIYNGLISSVTWTLSLEIMFYLIAPFIIKNRIVLFIILFLSIILRVILIYIGVGLEGGFTYRFFPNEIALFIIGALSHQIIKPFYLRFKKETLDKISNLFTIIFVIFCLVFALIPNIHISTFFMIGLLIILLPLIFHFQNIHSWDSLIGQYSYPIYICHFLVIVMITQLNIQNIYFYSISVLIFTIIFAHITIKLVTSSVEEFRLKNKN